MSWPSVVASVARSILRPVRRIPLLVVIVVAVSVGLGGGVAYGYFTSSGAGAGAAAAGTMRTVSVVTAGTPAGPLLPGGPAGDLVFDVSNPNDFPVSLVGAAFSAGGTVSFDPGHAGCGTTDGDPVVTVNVPAGDLPVSVPSNATVPVDLAAAVSMDVAATGSCQGAAINIPITITVHTS